MTQGLKLNLGCGANLKAGYINVDKYGEPDVRHDLETFPWPWQDNSVQEVILYHVLEHLGQQTEVFLNIIRELYRICVPNALIHITVPHPRHDSFLGDPTHVRPITLETLSLLSKRQNQKWIDQGGSNSPLALYLDVDFDIDRAQYKADPAWEHALQEGFGPESSIVRAMKKYNNVIKEIDIVLRVVKSP